MYWLSIKSNKRKIQGQNKSELAKKWKKIHRAIPTIVSSLDLDIPGGNNTTTARSAYPNVNKSAFRLFYYSFAPGSVPSRQRKEPKRRWSRTAERRAPFRASSFFFCCCRWYVSNEFHEGAL